MLEEVLAFRRSEQYYSADGVRANKTMGMLGLADANSACN